MRVKEMGEEVAVESEGKRISYRELNRRAEEVARRLRERGVKREEIVGLSVARSVEMVVGIVGIWKAGGAYLPLDPSYPGERLRYMVEDSGARVILSSGGEVEWIGKERCEVVGLEEEVGGEKERKEVKEGGGRGDAGAAAEEERIEPEQLAYVIYTSGSTGKPKGVGVEHRQLMSYVRGISRRLGLKKGMRYGMVSTYAADLGYTMLFPALCTGGCVDVVGAERVLDAWKMEEHWGKRPVDCLKIVPSHLKALMRSGSGKEEELLPREWLVLGGEASSWELMEEIRKLRPKCRVMNHYGPTETTVGELTYEVREVKEERGEEGEGGEKEEGRERGTVPLGRPLGNGAVYVLDEEMEVVGIGMEGEIYLGGGGVARGYVKRGDLTAERFVANPFSERGGERLYRSGDRGRWLESGEVEFLGRKDDQVKIRGNRIELGEIEEALREHAGIREAVVVAREEGGTGGEKRLVGYVVLREEEGGEREEEREGEGERYRLGNGMEIEQQSRRETEYQYKEIYEKQGYLRLGARLGKAGCVVDVGANIGMFALFASQWCPEGRVYALEPVEEVYEQLRKNAERYGGNRIQVYPYGLGEREEKKEFTYYRRNSMLSGVREYADEGEERELLRKFVERERAAAAAEGGGVEEGEGVQEEEVEELLGRQLESEVRVCRVRRLSDVMREEGLERIDLLKIDVQRAELDVLRGIEEEDWGKIGQIIMEVHDDGKKEKGGGGLAGVVEMLRRHGFREVVEQEESLAGTDRYTVYAVQKEKEEEIRGEGRGYGVKLEEVREEGGTRAEGTGIGGRGRITVEELQRYLGKRLPEYMVPGEMMVLEEMPLTANGKIDRQGMPAPGGRGKGEGRGEGAENTGGRSGGGDLE